MTWFPYFEYLTISWSNLYCCIYEQNLSAEHFVWFYCVLFCSIAECLNGRTDVQCLHRWQKVLNPELVKGPWTKEVLNSSTSIGFLRVVFQLSILWLLKTTVLFYLEFQEDDLIIELVEKHGCKKWSSIANSLPGRIGKQCRERSVSNSA